MEDFHLTRIELYKSVSSVYTEFCSLMLLCTLGLVYIGFNLYMRSVNSKLLEIVHASHWGVVKTHV